MKMIRGNPGTDRTGLAQGLKWTRFGLFNLLPTRRQAAFGARYIGILPTCHDKLECPMMTANTQTT
jgi:hypothetical protein